MPDASQPLLFQPFALRQATFKNRVVISPMVQYRAGDDGLPNDYHLIHLGKFAMGGAAAVFTEATAVEPVGRVTPADLGLWSADQLPAWRRLADAIRAEGALPAIQLAHAGRKASGQRVPDGGGPIGPAEVARGWQPWQAVGPTDEPTTPDWPAPRALESGEIAGLVGSWAASARLADAAGFDVLEIHGAHGYLIASFLSPVSNRRNDGYGGDLAGRMRIALEIAEAVRDAWPKGKPLFFRVSSVDGAEGGWSMADTVALAKELKARGVDVVDCSSGGLTGSATAAPVPRHPGFQVPFAAAVRREAGIASMAVGLILDGPQAEAVLQAGDADLIAVGREALYDPFVAVHWARSLGCDPGFALHHKEYGWWLDKRARSLDRIRAA
jgi:2,4-dienoyl-CoA reductase-like NADH-dependent reductase (Old Yellow Enzyme family)